MKGHLFSADARYQSYTEMRFGETALLAPWSCQMSTAQPL